MPAHPAKEPPRKSATATPISPSATSAVMSCDASIRGIALAAAPVGGGGAATRTCRSGPVLASGAREDHRHQAEEGQAESHAARRHCRANSFPLGSKRLHE